MDVRQRDSPRRAFLHQAERKFFGKHARVNHFFGRENEASRRGRRAAVEALPGEKLGKLQFIQSKIGRSSRRPRRRHIHHTIQTPVRLSLAKQQIRISQPPKEFFLKTFPNHQNQATVFVSSDNFLALSFYVTAPLFLLCLFLYRTDPFVLLSSFILPTLEINIALA
jgi:hypothetical protein